MNSSYYSLFISLFVFTCNKSYAADIEDLKDIHLEELSIYEPMFISLGSYCRPAHILRQCNLRKAAFPFDWIISFDLEGVIKSLETDFQDFFNKDYLRVYYRGGALLNTSYRLEFLHEGDWRDEEYYENMKNFVPKYSRRIERFNELGTYQGKVFFIRYAYPYSENDPNRYFRSADNLEITEEASLKLFSALKKKFPFLNFNLAIVNHQEENRLQIKKLIHESVYMCRTNLEAEMDETNEDYLSFFSSLVEGKLK